jgi:hypothetical protein
MTAMELARLQSRYQILLLSSTPQNTSLLERIRSIYPEVNCQIITLPPPFRFKYLNFKKKNYPRPKTMMNKAVCLLKNARAIISTSHETSKHCKRLNLKTPVVFYQYHGCGDRKYSFSPTIGSFDHILVPGNYYRERLLAEKITAAENISVVGYPKFDYLDKVKFSRENLFPNNRPIVLYTPHWDPRLNSFKTWGKQVFDYFAESKVYNLIFAPHIQMKHWKVKHGYDLNLEKYKAPNIFIDLGSISCVDMSYLNIADVYLGDVSSQVYEFVALRRRPVVFLNAHHVNWRDNPDYYFWEMGPVVEKFDEFEEKLRSALQDKSFFKIQEQRIGKYFALSDIPSSLKAAQFILARIESNA